MHSAAEQVVEAAEQHVGGFDWDEPADFDQFMASLPDMVGGIGAAVGRLADKARGDWPVEPGTADLLDQLATSLSGLSDAGQEAYAQHRRDHEREMERAENPRPGEQKWNV